MTDTSAPGEQLGSPPQGVDLGIVGCTDAVEIGRGGFGVVYRARQPEFNRTVAVKVLATAGFDDAARMRFNREVAAMGSVAGHPNIVTVHQAGFTPNRNAYMVMAFEPGGSLGDRLAAGGALSWTDTMAHGIKLAGALDTAHKAGILHRDVKPENVLVSLYGEPKLADFGIARVAGAAHTRSGVITTSIAHAAPEIVMGKSPSVASDVYALASTLYALMLGRPAFVLPTDESFVPMLNRIANEPPPDLRPAGVPDAMCQVLERATAKEPAYRQTSAAAFGTDLQRAQQLCGMPVTPMICGPQELAAPASAATAGPRPSDSPTMVVAPAPPPSSPGLTMVSPAPPVGAPRPDPSAPTSPWPPLQYRGQAGPSWPPAPGQPPLQHPGQAGPSWPPAPGQPPLQYQGQGHQSWPRTPAAGRAGSAGESPLLTGGGAAAVLGALILLGKGMYDWVRHGGYSTTYMLAGAGVLGAVAALLILTGLAGRNGVMAALGFAGAATLAGALAVTRERPFIGIGYYLGPALLAVATGLTLMALSRVRQAPRTPPSR